MRIFGERKKPLKTIFVGVTVIGILLSVSNELASVDSYRLGVAMLTRPLHAALGIIALFWVFLGFRLGLVALALWIGSSFVVIATDQSKEYFETILFLGLVDYGTFSHSSPDTPGPTIIYKYESLGVNFAPILVLGWFLYGWKMSFLPLCKWRPSVLKFKKFATPLLTVFLIGLVGCGFYVRWWLSAPYIIYALEPGMEFYFQDEKLGERFVRITPEVLEKIGLDKNATPEEYILHTGNYGWGIFLDDQTERQLGTKLITVATNREDPAVCSIETPWGERFHIWGRGVHEIDNQFQFFRFARNPNFRIQLQAPSKPVLAGKEFPVWVSIENKGKLPEFRSMRFSRSMKVFDRSEGIYPSVSYQERSSETPESFRVLNEGRFVEGEVQVMAPYRPGLYALTLQGWFRTASGGYASPIRSTGTSETVLVEVLEDAN